MRRAYGTAMPDNRTQMRAFAMLGLVISGLGVSYLPYRCLSPLVAAGMLTVIDVAPDLPPMAYVAMHKGEHRSSLIASIVMLAQDCCDFSTMFQGLGQTLVKGGGSGED